MEAVQSSRALVSNKQAIWCNNSENNFYLLCHENLKSCVKIIVGEIIKTVPPYLMVK